VFGKNEWIITHCFLVFFRSELVWKKLRPDDGFAVQASWPVAEEEDKILTRQAQLLRDSLKSFRTLAGKAKKGWQQVSILISDDYPQWKIDALVWMQEQYNKDGSSGFGESFMKDLKDWTTASVTDKKMVKFTMQFVSFRKKEVEDVGITALDIRLPFDQSEIFSESLNYIQSQLSLESIDIVKLGGSVEVPERVQENVEPGKPYLWFR
jgi:leucyl-tRNA synthetase